MRTELPTSRARGSVEDEVEDGAVIVCCCLASLTFALLCLFGSGAWPFVKAWLWNVFA